MGMIKDGVDGRKDSAVDSSSLPPEVVKELNSIFPTQLELSSLLSSHFAARMMDRDAGHMNVMLEGSVVEYMNDKIEVYVAAMTIILIIVLQDHGYQYEANTMKNSTSVPPNYFNYYDLERPTFDEFRRFIMERLNTLHEEGEQDSKDCLTCNETNCEGHPTNAPYDKHDLN